MCLKYVPALSVNVPSWLLIQSRSLEIKSFANTRVKVYDSIYNLPAKIEAEAYCIMSGIQTETASEGTLDVSYINNGDWLAFNNVNLTGMKSIKARFAGKTTGSTIEVRLSSTTGTLIATIPVTNTGGWQTWKTDSVNLATVSGTQDVFLVFKGGLGNLFNLNWFGFSDKANVVTGFDETGIADFEIYPNPVTTSFKILNKQGSLVEVLNTNGVQILKENISSENHEVNTSSLPIGVYLIKISNDTGTVTKKITKQ